MKVLLDLNILLDLTLAREPFATDARATANACADGRAVGFVSAAAIPTLFYIGQRTAGRDSALVAVDRCLASFSICPVDRSVLDTARRLAGPDFEDDVHIAAAAAASVDAIVTRDRADFAHSPLTVLSPSELVRRLENL